MSQHQFGSGLDDTPPVSETNQGAAPEPELKVEMESEELMNQGSDEAPKRYEKRLPAVLNFSPNIGGMPLELGSGAKATLVDGPDSSQWLVSLDAQGRLYIGLIQDGEFATIESPCPLFPDHEWAAFDAGTCDQTGHVIWAGFCLKTGDLYGCVELDQAFHGQKLEPVVIGRANELELPSDPSRIENLQLTDWFGRGRLEVVIHMKPAREPGGHSLQLLERKSDNFLEGFLPIQLADADTDRLLSGSDSARLLVVSWSGPGSDQFLYLDGKGELHLLTNFGGILPPGVGKPRMVVDSKTNAPASPGIGVASLAWVKAFGKRPARIIAVSSTGGVSIAETSSLSRLNKFAPVLSKSAGVLVFGPHAVATAVDWDNDGGLDIITGDAAGGLTLYADQGSSDVPEYGIPLKLESGGIPFVVPNRDSRRAATMDTAQQRFSCPVLNDWTSFNRYDVVVADNRGAVWYIRNNGGKTQPRLDFADRVSSGGSPLFVAPRCQLAVGNWSGGNEPDVIGFDTDGTLTYWARREKLDLKPGVKITDVRNRPIALSGTGKRAGLVHLWAGAWTSPESVELILSMPRFAIGRLADWLEIPIEKPLEEFPLFWILQKTEHGVTVKPLRTAEGKLIHLQMPDQSQSYTVTGVHYGGRSQTDLLVVPDQGRAMLWPRESLRWD